MELEIYSGESDTPSCPCCQPFSLKMTSNHNGSLERLAREWLGRPIQISLSTECSLQTIASIGSSWGLPWWDGGRGGGGGLQCAKSFHMSTATGKQEGQPDIRWVGEYNLQDKISEQHLANRKACQTSWEVPPVIQLSVRMLAMYLRPSPNTRNTSALYSSNPSKSPSDSCIASRFPTASDDRTKS